MSRWSYIALIVLNVIAGLVCCRKHGVLPAMGWLVAAEWIAGEWAAACRADRLQTQLDNLLRRLGNDE